MTSDIEDAARAWCSARQAVTDADSALFMHQIAVFDSATHDLVVACGFPCQCDPGTCPKTL